MRATPVTDAGRTDIAMPRVRSNWHERGRSPTIRVRASGRRSSSSVDAFDRAHNGGDAVMRFAPQLPARCASLALPRYSRSLQRIPFGPNSLLAVARG